MSRALCARSWKKLVDWMAIHAPLTHASLLPPITAEELRAALDPLGRKVPREIEMLYALAGGQSPSAGDRVTGLFRGFWFMPLESVDGLRQAWLRWQLAADGGAEWATENRFPFAKDFAGCYLCFEVPARRGEHENENENENEEASVVLVGDEEVEEKYSSLETLIGTVYDVLLAGELTLDRPPPAKTEPHVVQFDACRERNVGDRARHSVLDALGITATIEDLNEPDDSPFGQPRVHLYGLAVRLTGKGLVYEAVDVQATDGRERPVGGGSKGCGGGKPGVLASVSGKHPMPAGTRLRVTIHWPVKG